jgi:hypothetical protein
VVRLGETRNGYNIFLRKPFGKYKLGRPRWRWVDTIKIDFTEKDCEDGRWVEGAQYHVQWQPLESEVFNLCVVF